MKKHINQTFLRLGALALSTTLAACGGGGGGGAGTDSLNLTDISEAKALFDNLRSNGAMSGELRSRVESSAASFESAVSPASVETLTLLGDIISGAGLFAASPNDYIDFPSAGNGCIAHSDLAGTAIATDPTAPVKSFVCKFYTGTTFVAPNSVDFVTEAVITKDGDIYQAVTQAVTLSHSPTVLPTRTTIGANHTLTMQRAFAPTTTDASLSISGSLPTREQNLDVVAVNLTVKEEADNGFTKLSLNGSLAGKLNGDVKSTISIKEGSHLRAKTVTPGGVNSQITDYTGASAKITLEAALNGGAKATGTLAIDNFETLSNGISGPKTTSFNGLIQHPDGGTLFDGNISLKSAALPLNQGGAEALTTTTEIKGTLAIPSRPDLRLTAKIERSSATSSKITGNYIQGADTVKFEIMTDANDPAADSVSFMTLSGLGFKLTEGATEVPITKNGAAVGTFNRNTNKLVYANGSYQQF